MTEEFNFKKEIRKLATPENKFVNQRYLTKEQVFKKFDEFIKRLKEELIEEHGYPGSFWIERIIDKLAGDKLK